MHENQRTRFKGGHELCSPFVGVRDVRERRRETLTIYCWLLNFYYVARKKKIQQLELHFGGREGEYRGVCTMGMSLGWIEISWNLQPPSRRGFPDESKQLQTVQTTPGSSHPQPCDITPKPTPPPSYSQKETFFAKHEAKNGIFLSLPRRH
jgi:hypothetical protein